MPWEERVSALMVVNVTDTLVDSGLRDEEESSKTLRTLERKYLESTALTFIQGCNFRYEVTSVGNRSFNRYSRCCRAEKPT